jgi:Pyruvate/2-oxoacid:ferredoxin oxidoreductase delta subunit
MMHVLWQDAIVGLISADECLPGEDEIFQIRCKGCGLGPQMCRVAAWRIFP